MEQINEIELRDGNVYPDDSVLEGILGASFDSYKKLLGMFTRADMTHEWRYYRDGKAWLCKVQKKKKTIIWMSAWKGFMQATIYFPDKYAGALTGLPIAEETRNRIRSAKRVGKSIPCMFEIRNDAVLKDLERVMEYKISLK